MTEQSVYQASVGCLRGWLSPTESGLPCPPGYMQRNARPSSSAWTRPAGVSSPPHFSTSSREGSFLRTSDGLTHKPSWTLNTKGIKIIMPFSGYKYEPITFLLARGFWATMGKVCHLNFAIDAGKMAIPEAT